MSVKEINCQNNAPAYNYTPFGAACWWNKPLPRSLKCDIGPVTIPGAPCVGCSCYGFPSEVTRITLNFEPCSWLSGVMVWQNGNYETGLTMFVNPFAKIYQEDPDINPIANVFSFSGCPNPTGSCDYNPITGETTGTMSGVAEFEPQGCSCGTACLLPFTVYFNELL